jgi:hypothetical protein
MYVKNMISEGWVRNFFPGVKVFTVTDTELLFFFPIELLACVYVINLNNLDRWTAEKSVSVSC